MSGRPFIVFGIGNGSIAAAKMILEEQSREILAFTVDQSYLTAQAYDGVAVVPFDKLLDFYDPDCFELLLPLGYRNMNGFRADKLSSAKALGISVGSWVSERAHVPNDFIPKENTLIYPGAFIQPYSEIGRNCTLRSGVNLGHHSKVGDNCFLATGVVTGGNVQIQENCWIGLGAVIKNGITLAQKTFVGAGAVVLRDTESNRAYVGNPARQIPGKTSLGLTR
jgi:sugar O-acyltransferase (sialic acid O-acetyltransferase NeuD family)